MIPILGFVAWTIVGVFGLGAATLTVIAGYRREHPAGPPRTPSVGLPLASHHSDGAPLPVAHETGGVLNAATDAPLVAFDLASFPRAAFLDRLGAFALDAILVLITTQWLSGLFVRRGPGDNAFFLLLLAYHVGFWAWKGTTVGGIICQLRVVRVDGTRLRFVDALVRGLSSIFSFAVLGLGCLWILKGPGATVLARQDRGNVRGKGPEELAAVGAVKWKKQGLGWEAEPFDSRAGEAATPAGTC